MRDLSIYSVYIFVALTEWYTPGKYLQVLFKLRHPPTPHFSPSLKRAALKIRKKQCEIYIVYHMVLYLNFYINTLIFLS